MILNNLIRLKVKTVKKTFRRTKALRTLCEELNTTNTTYPGTDLVLNYSVKKGPGLP